MVIFAYFENAVAIQFAIILFYFVISTHLFFLSAYTLSLYCLKTIQYMVNFPPMHVLKSMREKKYIFKGEKLYLQQKSSKIMIRNFSKWIVTETKKDFTECLEIQGMGFTIYKLFKSHSAFSNNFADHEFKRKVPVSINKFTWTVELKTKLMQFSFMVVKTQFANSVTFAETSI